MELNRYRKILGAEIPKSHFQGTLLYLVNIFYCHIDSTGCVMRIAGPD